MFREGPGGDFCNYFLAFPSGFKAGSTDEQKHAQSAGREGILELCWNHGTGVFPQALSRTLPAAYQSFNLKNPTRASRVMRLGMKSPVEDSAISASAWIISMPPVSVSMGWV